MSGTTHRATIENGPSVVGGRLVWTSATGITTADPNSYGGCTRKWFYEQVEDKKAPPTEAMLAGTDLHSEVENRLRTGASLQSPIALSGSSFIPHPGSGLLIEKPIRFATRSGVQIYGHVDLYNLRGQYIDVDGVLQQDPPWVFEVKDWKTLSNFQYAKTESELAANIQLITYAEAGFRDWPDFEHSRLTHVYFRTRGMPASKLVTIRRSRDEIAARWEYSESVVRVMGDAARESNANNVPANRKACDAYSGCPHRGYCAAYQYNSLEAVYGKIAADHIQEKQTMGLLVSNPQTTQPPAVSMQQQLAQEEITMRAQVAQQQQQMPYQLNTAQLLDATRRLGSYGFGMPSLGGNAAQAYALAGGQSVPAGFVYNGIAAPPGAKRSLHTVLLNEVAHIFQLESELADERASQAAPHAPAVQEPSVKVQSQPIVAGILPPDAPESIPQLAQVYDSPAPPQPETTFANVIVTQPTLAQEAATEPKKRGRPPKKIQDTTPEPVALAPHQATQIAAMSTPPPDALATPVAPAVVSAYPVGTVENPTPQIHHEMNELFVILVNARCDGLATKSLAAYVDYINETVAKKYNTTRDGRQGPLDVRAAVEGSGLGYGGWKGFVREIVKVDPPPAGLYHFDTYMSELNEIVADALRVVAEAKGWLFVRGVRT